MKWPFKLKIIFNEEALFAGGNRNCACENSTGNLLICQDADDIPHPKRIEIIKFLFENYVIDHLLHLYVFKEKQFENLANNQVDKCFYYKNFDKAYYKTKKLIQNGQPAITREVFDAVKWSCTELPGEDIDFNRRVYEIFENNALLNVPLIFYRISFSFYRQNLEIK